MARVIVRLLVMRNTVLTVAIVRLSLRTGELELVRVAEPVDGVRAEEAAEEQHLRGQEHPDPQPLGGVLLLQVVEVVLEHR